MADMQSEQMNDEDWSVNEVVSRDGKCDISCDVIVSFVMKEIAPL
jgi:hypothetical protein